MSLQISGKISYRANLAGTISGNKKLSARIVRGGGGVSSYNDLTDLPSINNETVEGDKTGHDYGLANLSDIPIIPPAPVYNIIKRVIYTDSAFGVNPVNVDIQYDNDESLSDYDVIIIYYADQLDPTLFFGTIIIPSININDVFYCGYSGRVNRSVFSNDSFKQLSVSAPGEDERYAPHVYKIIGIKLGAIV